MSHRVAIIALLAAAFAGCSVPHFRPTLDGTGFVRTRPYHKFAKLVIEPFLTSHDVVDTDSISLSGRLTVYAPNTLQPETDGGRFTSIGRTLLFVDSAQYPVMLSARMVPISVDSQQTLGDYTPREIFSFSATQIPASVKRIVVVYEVFRTMKKGREIPRAVFADTLYPYPIAGENSPSLWTGPERGHPFCCPSNSISYLVDGGDSADVRIVLYNVLGQELSTLVDERQSRGPHDLVVAPPPGSPSGIYFVRLTINGISTTKKLAYLK